MTSKPRKKRINQYRKLAVAGIVVVLLLLAGLVLYAQQSHTPSKNVSASKSPSTSASPSTKPINPYSGTQTSSSPASQPTNPVPTPTPNSSNLVPPTGDLLSANPASINATASETEEESTCQTVLGASCEIVLVSPSGQTSSFNAPSVNNEGLHLVDWKVSQYISKTGTWKIYARETLNSETADSNIYSFQVNP